MRSPAMLSMLVLALAHAGCAVADADSAKAGEVTETRSTGDFHALDLAGTIAVEAQVGGATKVEVIGPADKVKLVKTSVKGGVLVIDTERDMKNAKHLRVVVTAPSLDAVSISGTGSLAASKLSGKLDVSIGGTGSMKLDGKAPSLAIKVDGTGQIDAKGLIAGSATVDIGGTGSMSVHASKDLDITITGTGSVKVHGNPSVKKHITGTGSVSTR